MRAPLASLILLSLLTFTAGLGRQAISDGDEGFYAEAAREMVESGDWLTPHFNYADRWQKPILYYWVAAATFAVTGTSEWGARGFASLSGVVLVIVTYFVGRRMFGRADTAWLGAAITATCYGYFALARLALPDLPLALFTTIGIFFWLERRPALAGLAAALGFLDKGPLALVVPALVLLPIAWRESRWKNPDAAGRPVSLSATDFVLAGAVFLVVAAPWYVAMVAEHGVAYLQSFFVADNLERFATDRFNSPRALWFYIPILIGGIFPWTVFLLVLPWRRGLEVLKRRADLTTIEWRLVIWTVAPLVFFTASVGKQPRYILPVLPPLALLLASSIVKRVRRSNREHSDERGLAAATWATASIYFVLAALLWRAGPLLINAQPRLTLAAVAVCAGAGFMLVWTAATAAWSALPMRMAVSAAALLVSLQFGALAGARPEAVETIAALVKANRGNNETLVSYRMLERNLSFYTGLRQLQVYDDQQALTLLGSSERVLLVARAQDVLRLQSATSTPLLALGSVRYMDPSSIRVTALLMPAQEDIVTTLMLVSNR